MYHCREVHEVHSGKFLNSTEKYTQYLVLIYNGKESEKVHMYTHTHTYLNHFAVHQKLSHYKSIILQLRKELFVQQKKRMKY